MNERIKELLNICGMPNDELMAIYEDETKSFYLEQFAVLIIKECFEKIVETCDEIDISPEASSMIRTAYIKQMNKFRCGGRKWH